MGRSELTIVVSCDGKKLCLDAVGDIDQLGGRQLLDTISTAVDLRCRDVSVDLGHARFADASAIEALVHAERRLRTGHVRLQVLNAAVDVARQLQEAGLQRCLHASTAPVLHLPRPQAAQHPSPPTGVSAPSTADEVSPTRVGRSRPAPTTEVAR